MPHTPTAPSEPARVTIRGEKFVIVPEAEYESLMEALEDIEDAAAVNAFHAARDRGEAMALPREQWDRIHAGVSAIKVIRDYRGLTQAQLSEKSGVGRPDISAIEGGKKRGSVDTLRALARALAAPLDVIVGD